jgi:cellulose synthase/poly-beta-1,6-N-acetylglucosamine synthase-like glycosyltransferase
MQPDANLYAEFPKVTVAICARNAAGTIKACLNSLMDLDYPKEKLKILLVNNASTDTTSDIAAQYPVTIFNENHIGRGHARNAAWKNCKTDLIAFTDADCRVSRGWLKELAPFFLDKKTAIVGGDIVTPGTEPLARYFELRQIVSNREFSGNYPYSPPFLATANALFRVQAIADAGGFKTHYRVAEDADICWRIQNNGWYLKYVNKGEVFHDHRTTRKAMFRQAIDYGFDGVSVWLEFHPETRLWIWYGLYCRWLLSMLKIPLFIWRKDRNMRQFPLFDLIRFSGLAFGRIKAGWKHRRWIM